MPHGFDTIAVDDDGERLWDEARLDNPELSPNKRAVLGILLKQAACVEAVAACA